MTIFRLAFEKLSPDKRNASALIRYGDARAAVAHFADHAAHIADEIHIAVGKIAERDIARRRRGCDEAKRRIKRNAKIDIAARRGETIRAFALDVAVKENIADDVFSRNRFGVNIC